MSEESQYSDHPGGWIEWFCAHEDHQFLCEVDDDYIKDPFNQYGVRGKFKFFNEAINMILQPQAPEDQDLEDERFYLYNIKERFLEVYQEASDIYGLFHASFIFTSKGSAIMRERFLQGKFGHCPRIYCEKQNVIPIGLCEDIKAARIKVFCPRCEEVYLPKKKCADIDGAYFGRSFPQFLLMTYPDLHPKFHLLPATKIKVDFEPTLFGFKIAGKQGSKTRKIDQPVLPNHIITQPIIQQMEQNIHQQEQKQYKQQEPNQEQQQQNQEKHSKRDGKKNKKHR